MISQILPIKLDIFIDEPDQHVLCVELMHIFLNKHAYFFGNQLKQIDSIFRVYILNLLL